MSSWNNTVNYHNYEEGARMAARNGNWRNAARWWYTAADLRDRENRRRGSADRGHIDAVIFCLRQERRCIRNYYGRR